MNDSQRAAVNKRLTLNLLIQGVAAHTFLTSHHLVGDRLKAIDPELLGLYDRLVVSFDLNAWLGDLTLLVGRPGRFWSSTQDLKHPFHHHPLLSRHGKELAWSSKRLVVSRAREKRVYTSPGVHYAQMMRIAYRVIGKEGPHRPALADLAVEATSEIWGIDRDRLRGEITLEMDGFTAPPASSVMGRLMRCAVAGYSQVERDEGRFLVRGRAVTWVLLLHELVKGVAELVCLNGMARMGDSDYSTAIEGADVLEQEHWLMQAGAELWRRLLAIAPKDRTLAECLMQLAILPAERLEEIMLAVCQRAPQAEPWLAALSSSDG